MTNGPHGTLYLGVTSDLVARVSAHGSGSGSEFCRKHGLIRRVYVERFDSVEDAIAREETMKRQRKLKLIRRDNPNRNDLFETING